VVPLAAVDWLVAVAAVTWPVVLLEIIKGWRGRHLPRMGG
jgi:hypothetical protein